MALQYFSIKDQIAPFYAVQHNAIGHEAIGLYKQAASLIQTILKETVIDDYLKLWRGNILIDFQNSAQRSSYEKIDIALIGNNNQFYQGAQYSESDYRKSIECDGSEDVPERFKTGINQKEDYPKKQAYLYFGIDPNFLQKDKIKLTRKLLTEFVSSIYLDEEDMDVEAYLFNSANLPSAFESEPKPQPKIIHQPIQPLKKETIKGLSNEDLIKISYWPAKKHRSSGAEKNFGRDLEKLSFSADVKPAKKIKVREKYKSTFTFRFNLSDTSIPLNFRDYKYNIAQYFTDMNAQYYYQRKAFLTEFITDARSVGSHITKKEALGAREIFMEQLKEETTSEELKKLGSKAFGPKPTYEDKMKIES